MERVSARELDELLRWISGRGYSAYKKLRRLVIDYDNARAVFTKVQADPYAPPSILEAIVPRRAHRLPGDLLR
ncbi:MAG: ABC-ATPase domain-containing protein, partial [Pyrodictiaceae archaeon]